MSDSPLINYTCLSPNYSSRNGHAIEILTFHHCAGIISVETGGNIFKPTARKASCNYLIGSDARKALIVPEKYRSWCTSSRENDERAITFEISNSSLGGVWPVSDAVLKSTIELAIDVCKRNGIKRVNYTGDKSGNITLHEWFAATNCPGSYLKSKMPEIAAAINAGLTDGTIVVPSAPVPNPPASSGAKAYIEKGFGGSYTCMVDNLPVLDTPSASAKSVATYKKGQIVVLDDTYYIADGNVYGTYIGNSGNRRYICVGKNTGKADSNDNLIKGGKVVSSASTGFQVTGGTYEVVTPSGLYVHSDTTTSAATRTGTLYKPTRLVLDNKTIHTNGYYWGTYIANSGKRRYVAVKSDTGEVLMKKV